MLYFIQLWFMESSFYKYNDGDILWVENIMNRENLFYFFTINSCMKFLLIFVLFLIVKIDCGNKILKIFRYFWIFSKFWVWSTFKIIWPTNVNYVTFVVLFLQKLSSLLLVESGNPGLNILKNYKDFFIFLFYIND